MNAKAEMYRQYCVALLMKNRRGSKLFWNITVSEDEIANEKNAVSFMRWLHRLSALAPNLQLL